MIACTSPLGISRSTPVRISRAATRSWRFSIFNIVLMLSRSTDRAFEAHVQQFLRLDREFHRQLLEHLAAEPVHDHVDRVLFVETALPAIEQLVLADLRGRR